MNRLTNRRRFLKAGAVAGAAYAVGRVAADAADAQASPLTTVRVGEDQETLGKNKKGRLRLCRMAPGIREVFQIIRLDQVLEIKDTREEALAAFRAR